MSTMNEFLGFDPHATEAAESFEGRQEPVPNGQYKAVASSAARKHNKNNTGWITIGTNTWNGQFTYDTNGWGQILKIIPCNATWYSYT